MEEGTIPEPTDAPIQVGTPRSPRRKVVFSGIIETMSGKIRVAVKNVSCTGAMVEGEGLPPPGRDVVLHMEDLELFGAVVWTDDNHCGVHFDEALTQAQVLELHRITPETVHSAELKAAAEWYSSQTR
jgi:hypothetical protein